VKEILAEKQTPARSGKEQNRTSATDYRQHLFTKITDRVLTPFAVTAETAMAHLGKFTAADGLPGEDTGQDQVKDGYIVKHTAGRQSQDRYLADSACQKHGTGQDRRAVHGIHGTGLLDADPGNVVGIY
jgi:hypothetical protein